MEIRSFCLTPFQANCFVLSEGECALVVDPGDAPPGLLAYLDGFAVQAIVNTHGHCDHTGGNAGVRAHTEAPLCCHEADLPLLRTIAHQGAVFGVPTPESPEPDRLIADGDSFRVGNTDFQVAHTPGHSPGHIVLIGGGIAVVGDVLFAGSIGRSDLPGGNDRQLIESIRTRLLTLPDETVVYCGHGPATAIGTERRTNPFLVGL